MKASPQDTLVDGLFAVANAIDRVADKLHDINESIKTPEIASMPGNLVTPAGAVTGCKPGIGPIYDRPWDEVLPDLSVRAYNCLKNIELYTGNLKTMRDLTLKTPKELLDTRNFGKKALKEITEQLGELGLSLAEDYKRDGSRNGVAALDSEA